LLLTLFVVCLGTLAVHAAADNPLSIEVWKSATCECCGNWVKHLEANGFAVKVNATDSAALERLKAQAGISSKLAACHTAKIGGYVFRHDSRGETEESHPFGCPKANRLVKTPTS
jgi:hypothetical protein